MGLRLSEVWLNAWDVNTTGHYSCNVIKKSSDVVWMSALMELLKVSVLLNRTCY